jgi:mono/diheme cytochrome c family protein
LEKTDPERYYTAQSTSGLHGEMHVPSLRLLFSAGEEGRSSQWEAVMDGKWRWFLGGALLLLIYAAAASADDVRYTTHIKAVFDRQCSMCHGAGSPEYGDFKKEKERYTRMVKGPKMDSYAHLVHFTGWPDTGALMRRLDDGKGTKDGTAGNMYPYLGSDDAERQKNLALFKAWVGNWTLKRLPELTKEDLTGILVKY